MGWPRICAASGGGRKGMRRKGRQEGEEAERAAGKGRGGDGSILGEKLSGSADWWEEKATFEER